MFMVLTSRLTVIAWVPAGSRDKCRTAPDGCRPVDQADSLLLCCRPFHPAVNVCLWPFSVCGRHFRTPTVPSSRDILKPFNAIVCVVVVVPERAVRQLKADGELHDRGRLLPASRDRARVRRHRSTYGETVAIIAEPEAVQPGHELRREVRKRTPIIAGTARIHLRVSTIGAWTVLRLDAAEYHAVCGGRRRLTGGGGRGRHGRRVRRCGVISGGSWRPVVHTHVLQTDLLAV